VAAIALVDVDAPDLDACVPLDVGDGAFQRVAVEGIAGLRLGVQSLVAERMHVLENEETGEEPHRQWRLSVSSRVDLAEAPVEETPVDLPGQPHQRMAHVDDRLQGRPEKVRLPIVARFRHLDLPRRIDARIESKNARRRNPKSQETRRATDLSCKNDYFGAPANPNRSTSYRFFPTTLQHSSVERDVQQQAPSP
jgi:hypothetical protein